MSLGFPFHKIEGNCFLYHFPIIVILLRKHKGNAKWITGMRECKKVVINRFVLCNETLNVSYYISNNMLTWFESDENCWRNHTTWSSDNPWVYCLVGIENCSSQPPQKCYHWYGRVQVQTYGTLSESLIWWWLETSSGADEFQGMWARAETYRELRPPEKRFCRHCKRKPERTGL